MAWAETTIVIATWRSGGAVLPLQGLREQVYKDFDIVLVTECGAEAWRGEELPTNAQVIEVPPIPFHAPSHLWNHGIDEVTGQFTLLLTDFARPCSSWAGSMIADLKTEGVGVSIGVHCSRTQPEHGCETLPLPSEVFQDSSRAQVFPSSGCMTIGNVGFHSDDLLAVGGIDERFSGLHDAEYVAAKNIGRRLIMLRRRTTILANRMAVLHRTEPLKRRPALRTRPWALGVDNNALEEIVVDEMLHGSYKAARVPLGGG